MLPIIPTLVLAFVSFFASAFVILRIVIPILPPHPLSRRVPPSEFGLPNFKSLSPADKSHIWLASFDILALAVFVWQVITEYLGGPSGYAIAQDPASAVRLWLATTLRQSCLLIVASLTLLHVRLGRPVSFGSKHWMLWAPTLLLAVTSTALAGVFAGTDVASFYIGLTAYSATLAIMASVAFGCLIGTLVIIKRNLAALNEMRDTWPAAIETSARRQSFATEDVEVLKDGSSWITSRASSRRDSISAFSFSTHHTHHSAKPSNGSIRLMHSAMASNPSIPMKSSYWFNPSTPHLNGRESPVPPVPPLPSPYRPSTTPSTGTLQEGAVFHEEDPFRRQAPRMGSQSSWLSEHFSEQATLSAWSFPASRPGTPVAYPSTPDLHTELLPSTAVSRPMTPAMVSTDVLGGYGFSAEAVQAEKGIAAVNAATGSDVDVSVYRAIGWLVTIWVPLAFSLPYYLMLSPTHPLSPMISSVLLIMSVTLSSPLLALNILFRSPLPIPTGLFDSYSEPPSVVRRAPSPASTLPVAYSHEYKRSGSVTVVEGRRSGDIWIANGDAVDGRNKLERAFGLLSAKPKLSVLPTGGKFLQEELLTPPLPIQTHENMPSVPHTPQSAFSAELGRGTYRPRKDSKASSHYSGADDSMAFATQIMIAQRHYSALATKVVLPPSPERRASSMDVAATGVETTDAASRSSHLRARSVSSIPCPPVSPPPSSPLPPTPPSVRERKAARLTHRKSYSSGFSFGAIDNTAEIDALSAGVLPLLVPGLRVGSGVKISKDWKVSPPTSLSKGATKGSRRSKQFLPKEMGGVSIDFSSPEIHSTPAERHVRTKKISTHKRHHFSLPSLSLGKDGIHSMTTWRTDVNRALDNKVSATVNDANRRNTMQWEGDDFATQGSGASQLNGIREEEETPYPTSNGLYAAPRRPVGPMRSPTDVPENIASVRNSLNTLINALNQEFGVPPPSANSEVTLFDFDPEDGSGPQAESTPHESQRTHTRYSGQHDAPPVPQLPKSSRRSSIVYIKSDENTAPAPAPATTSNAAVRPTTSPLAQITSRVRPLIPKMRASKVQAKSSSSPNGSSENSPGGGLRPLSLLQNRDMNQGTSKANVRPLTPGKKKKSKVVVVDENDPQGTGSKTLKPLKLVRSETTKERAALRAREVLPDVIVRPPSQYSGHGY